MFLAWGPGPGYIEQMVPSQRASFKEETFAIHGHWWCSFLLLSNVLLVKGSHCVAREHDELGKPLLVGGTVLHWWKLKASSPRRSRGPALQSGDFSCTPSFLPGDLAESHHFCPRPHPRHHMASRTHRSKRTYLLLHMILEMFTLGLILVRPGARFDPLPKWPAGRGSGKTIVCRQNILASYQKTWILPFMTGVVWSKAYTCTHACTHNLWTAVSSFFTVR